MVYAAPTVPAPTVPAARAARTAPAAPFRILGVGGKVIIRIILGSLMCIMFAPNQCLVDFRSLGFSSAAAFFAFQHGTAVCRLLPYHITELFKGATSIWSSSKIQKNSIPL